MKKKRGGSRVRSYYDPGRNPKPRAIIGGQELEANVAKETRQLRRKRERESRRGK